MEELRSRAAVRRHGYAAQSGRRACGVEPGICGHRDFVAAGDVLAGSEEGRGRSVVAAARGDARGRGQVAYSVAHARREGGGVVGYLSRPARAVLESTARDSRE